ncbi:uncharacterized protein LOC142139885 [Mixophyes fleayi]|uniref:uncharacterized protein LOC142139885 n=1 Tax=Mixophyes fleayi TaxID=3061075 RepID=UPI003F4E2B89
MQYFQVPKPGTSQSGLQASLYQYVYGVSSQGHLERVGQTLDMFDTNFLSVEGSVRPQGLTAQGSSWYYEPQHPVSVYPETLTLNKWNQRHDTIGRIQHYPLNSLAQVPHRAHSCNNQQVGLTGHFQYPGLTQVKYLPTTEPHNTRGQMFFQPTVYVQQQQLQQQQLPIMNQIPSGYMYPRIKPPNARKSLPLDFNTQVASQEPQTTMTIMSPKVTPVKNRADVHSHMDSGPKISQKLTKNSMENFKKRTDSSICGTHASNTMQDNVALDDTKRFFRWDNKQMDPSKTYSTGSKPAISFSKGHTTLRYEQLEPLPDSNTLLSPGDICTDEDTMAPTIITGVSSNIKHRNVPHGQKITAKHILGYFAKDLLSSDYEDPAVSMLFSSMDYFYKVAPHGDIESKKNTPKSTHLPSSNNLATWYSIFKKRRLCKLKAKTAKYKKICQTQKWKETRVNILNLRSILPFIEWCDTCVHAV